MNTITRPLRIFLAVLPALSVAASGCGPSPARAPTLPPAYTSKRITDPALRRVADEIRAWAARQPGAAQKPLYSRIEILRPVPTVQPYGVGVYQQELRLPVILTTGPGWGGLAPAKKEEAAGRAFQDISEQLRGLDREPSLKPTLTIQTPQGLEIAWINRLDPSGRNVHGND